MISIANLQDSLKYKQLDVLEHDNIVPFVKEQIGHKNIYTRFYWIFNVLIMVALIVLVFTDISQRHLEFSKMILYFIIGAALSLTVLIPIHELIHGITYKMVGAPKVSYGGDIKKFVFYAAADKFVIGRKKFTKVALAPFIVVTFFALLSLAFTSDYTKWISLGILFGHTTACGGDFGMMSYFEKYKEKEIYTYDDNENKISYFYEKI